jgi:hypothetical protein
MKKINWVIIVLLASCADSKEINIGGKDVLVEPYGWFDSSVKNDSVIYKINTGNVILSVIFLKQ